MGQDQAEGGTGAPVPRVLVFDPTPLMTVTVETAPDGTDEVHVHGGGQGFWVSRMVVALGLEARLCCCIGGPDGPILKELMEREGVGVVESDPGGRNGVLVFDRRSGAREVIAHMPPAVLSRHVSDALYTSALSESIEADIVVLAGPRLEETVADDVYRRLATDMDAIGRPVMADLSGSALTAALEGGLTAVKVSHEQLLEDGRVDSDDPKALAKAMTELAGDTERLVVVSRAGEPAMALAEGRLLEVEVPPLHPVDERGAGDSMTAGIAVALARGAPVEEALRLGAAAGALNVTRHGLATGERLAVERLVGLVEIRPAG